jgi:hypothetical protein
MSSSSKSKLPPHKQPLKPNRQRRNAIADDRDNEDTDTSAVDGSAVISQNSDMAGSRPRDSIGKFLPKPPGTKTTKSKISQAGEDGGGSDTDNEGTFMKKISREQERQAKRDVKRALLIEVWGEPPPPLPAKQWTPEQIAAMRVNTQVGSQLAPSQAQTPGRFSSREMYRAWKMGC